MKKAKLTSEERIFFKPVHNAAFANPFSDLREKLDIKIAGLFPLADRRETGTGSRKLYWTMLDVET